MTEIGDSAAIAAVRDAWVAAVAARDVDAIRSLLTDDYEVWAHGAPPMRGDGAAAAMAAALGKFEIAQSFDPIETVVSGDWAFERGIERMIVTSRDGSAPARDVSQRALLILHRGADGRWRYARGMTNGLPPT